MPYFDDKDGVYEKFSNYCDAKHLRKGDVLLDIIEDYLFEEGKKDKKKRS